MHPAPDCFPVFDSAAKKEKQVAGQPKLAAALPSGI
jgi:hypothetical protein